MELTEFLDLLHGVKRRGSGFTALCPAHGDKNPSLSISQGDDGRIIVYCFTGCTTETILESLGLEMKDLFNDNLPAPSRKVVGRFDYHSADGQLLYWKERVEPGKDGRLKDFYFYHGDKESGRGTRPVLYCLPAIASAKTIIFNEGEAKADAVNAWMLDGCAATSLDSGAKSVFPAEMIHYLSGKDIVVIPDNDIPGRQYANNICKALYGRASTLKVIALPNIDAKQDVVDWIKRTDNPRDAFLELISLAPKWTPKERIKLTLLSDLLNKPRKEFRWLLDGVLPSGGLSLLVAKPKVGKSTLARHLSLCVARGNDFLGRKVHKGPVIYLALEEVEEEVTRHFQEMKASEEEIFVLVEGAPQDAIQKMRHEVEEIQPTLIVVDPLFRLVRVSDSNDYVQVTSAIEPLLLLGRETGAHILCVHHSNKGSGDGVDTILGSIAIAGSVDTIIALSRKNNEVSMKTIQRYGKGLDETKLTIDPKTRMFSLDDIRKWDL